MVFLPIYSQTFAHRSGCHRWHSCPSDSGSYTCGDLGYPCRYPTYPEGGSSGPTTQTTNKYSNPGVAGTQTNQGNATNDEEMFWWWVIVIGLLGFVGWGIVAAIKKSKQNTLD